MRTNFRRRNFSEGEHLKIVQETVW